MRVMLFGNDYNRLAVACLSAVVETGRYEVQVGVCVPHGRGLLATARKAMAEAGPGFVVRRGIDLVRAGVGSTWRRVRGDRTGFGSLREAARVLDVPVVDVTRLNRPETRDAVAALAPDVILVAGFSRIIKAPIIATPTLGCINVHPSLLPAYRGPNPLYWVLANGEPETGVTVHYVDEGIDTGDIILQRSVPIRAGDDERVLFHRCIGVAREMVRETLDRFSRGPVPGVPQDMDAASYFPHPPRGASTL